MNSKSSKSRVNPNRKILLFTNSFPYGSSEPFLSPELKIAMHADISELVIVPFKIKGNSRWGADHPAIDKSLAIHIAKYHETKIWPLFLSLPAIIKGVFTHRVRSFKAFQDVAGFAHHGRLVAQWARDHVKKNDVLYTYWFERITYGLALFKEKSNSRQYLVSRAHGYDLYEERRAHRFLPYRLFSLNQLDRVFFISAHGYRYLSEKYPTYNSMEVSRLGVPVQQLNSTRSRTALCMVSCSSVIKLKRVDLIFESLNLLAAGYEGEIHWVHFGGGRLLKQLETLTLGKSANLKVSLQGQVQNQDVIDFYNNNYVDIFINLSDSEGIPVSIMEAISFGIPVVARDVGGNSEITNRRTGTLLSGDPSKAEIVRALRNLVDNPLDRKGVQQFHREMYNAGSNYQSFYNRIIAGK